MSIRAVYDPTHDYEDDDPTPTHAKKKEFAMNRQWLLSATVATLLVSPATAQNLIQNGDFSNGNTGFASDYTRVATNQGVYTIPPDCAVITNPATAFVNGYLSYGDHTSGTGMSLFFDGAGSSYDVWRQAVTLAANTTYKFSYYASTPDGGQPSGTDLVDLQAKLNGAAALGSSIITGQGSAWQFVSTSFTSGAAGSYVLALSDLNGTAASNDGIIDDLSLTAQTTPAVPEPAAWGMMMLGLALAGAVLRTNRRKLPARA